MTDQEKELMLLELMQDLQQDDEIWGTYFDYFDEEDLLDKNEIQVECK